MYQKSWTEYVKDLFPALSWGTVMAAIVGGFMFLHGDIKHQCERLDTHMDQTQSHFQDIMKSNNENNIAMNKRIDEQNKRSDDLHKEFYSLLKEMNKKN